MLEPFEFVLLARGVLFSSEAAVCGGEAEVRFRNVRGQFDGLLQLGGGARRLVGGEQRPAQNDVRGEIAGTGLHGHLAVLQRALADLPASTEMALRLTSAGT